MFSSNWSEASVLCLHVIRPEVTGCVVLWVSQPKHLCFLLCLNFSSNSLPSHSLICLTCQPHSAALCLLSADGHPKHAYKETHLSSSAVCVFPFAKSAVGSVRQWDHRPCVNSCWCAKCQLSRWCWTSVCGVWAENKLPPLVMISCVFCFTDKYAEFDLNDQGEIGE